MPDRILSNGEIASEILALAQILTSQRENPFKIKAYRRAAKTIRELSESVQELVESGEDLTQYRGIGTAISGVIQEIVRTGTLSRLEKARAEISPELLEISSYPRLDVRRILRIYKKLGISSIAALKERLENGEIGRVFGARLAQHVRHGLSEADEMLWYEAQSIVASVTHFLTQKGTVRRAEPAGDYRRRLETVSEISFLVETEDFGQLLAKLQRFGGKAELLHSSPDEARLRLSSGTVLRIRKSASSTWGRDWILQTGSETHVEGLRRFRAKWRQIDQANDGYPSEAAVYEALGLSYIPPELREGRDEIELAARRALPDLIDVKDIRGELHAHSTSSDGVHTIEEMAEAATERGLEYLGMSDHSQSLKIARGLSEEALWQQIRHIDKINNQLSGIRILKSAEVDILADGTLDYPDALLKELDYTVCSIHSRFGFGKEEQTTRIMRAMDNRYFNILGHATGRLLLKRPGYEIDVQRVVEHARMNKCSFEINSSPDRLDLSAENARIARQAGVSIAITTDAHSVYDFDFLQYGIHQARRAGLEKTSVLNHLPWSELEKRFKR